MPRIRTCSNLAGKGGGASEPLEVRTVYWPGCASVGDRHTSAWEYQRRTTVAPQTAPEGTGEAMTYSPGSPGYPPTQSPGGYGGSSTPSFAKSNDGESHLPRYLTFAVVALGLVTYLVSFGDLFTVASDDGQVGGMLVGDGGFGVLAALLAALLAGVGLLPKARNYLGVVAAISVLGALEVIIYATHKPEGLTVAWALWLIL